MVENRTYSKLSILQSHLFQRYCLWNKYVCIDKICKDVGVEQQEAKNADYNNIITNSINFQNQCYRKKMLHSWGEMPCSNLLICDCVVGIPLQFCFVVLLIKHKWPDFFHLERYHFSMLNKIKVLEDKTNSHFKYLTNLNLS